MQQANRLLARIGREAQSYPSDHELQAKLSLVQGWVLSAQGKPVEAKQNLTLSLAAATRAFGETDARTIDALRALAQVESDLLDFGAASISIAEADRRATLSADVFESDLTGIQFEHARIELLTGNYAVAAGRTVESAV